MESITQGVNFYMQQYDQHTPQSGLRGPASPLLAAPPDFNVNAQQRVLLQQQLLIQQQQQQQHLDFRTCTVATRLSVQTDSVVIGQKEQAGPLESTPALIAVAAATSSSHSVAAATTELAAASAVGEVSPIAMPSRPQSQGLIAAQQHLQRPQQQLQQLQQPTSSPLPSPACPPANSSGSSLLGPAPVQPETVVATPAASWAPFEVREESVVATASFFWYCFSCESDAWGRLVAYMVILCHVETADQDCIFSMGVLCFDCWGVCAGSVSASRRISRGRRGPRRSWA